MTGTVRLDVALVERGLARSRSHAQQLIVAGAVHVNGGVTSKPADRIRPGDQIVSVDDGYVSRAAHKLIGALDDLDLPVGARVLDAGSSTGGFTQVLLERGAEQVYAVDVGTDQLAATLRTDPRVVVWEQTNLRDLELHHVGGQPVDLVVADVSFISLVLLMPRLAAVTRRTGMLLLMVKPQFEVGRARLGKGGVVRSTTDRREAINGVVVAAVGAGWYASRVVRSRLPGPAGNVEYFVLFGPQRPSAAVGLEDALTPDPA